MPPFYQNFLLLYPLVHSIGSMKPDIALNLSLANIPRALGNAELRVLVRTFFPWDA